MVNGATGSGRRASFAGMINSSGRDTVRQQEELPDPEGCETMRKIVKSPGNLPQRGGEGLSSLWPTLWPELERLLVTLPGRGTGVTLQISASRAAPGKSGLHARGEGERVLALESRDPFFDCRSPDNDPS